VGTADDLTTPAACSNQRCYGLFTLFGGQITAVSGYTTDFSHPNELPTSITVTFRALIENPVLAWAGHISTRKDWGANNSAVAVTGSPYHSRLLEFDPPAGNVGNQDKSLSADAVIFPGSITIIKDAVPNDAQDFSFSTTGGLSPASFVLDDDADPTHSNTQLYSNILVTDQNGNDYTVTETTVTGWTLGSPRNCTVTSPNGGTQNTSYTDGVSINLRKARM
jgi:hypothetical protein